MKSILQQIAQKRAEATSLRARERATTTDPHVAYEAGHAAKKLESEALALEEARADNLRLAASIRQSLGHFEVLAYRSAGRSTAVRKLREAAMWLEEEAGRCAKVGEVPSDQ